MVLGLIFCSLRSAASCVAPLPMATRAAPDCRNAGLLLLPRRHAFRLEKKAQIAPTQMDGDSVQRFTSLLRDCGKKGCVSEGKRVHALIIQSGLHGDKLLGNHLMQMYGNCGELKDAIAVFEGMHHRNVFSWTIMMKAYVQNGYAQRVLQLFQLMQVEGVIPDTVAFATVLSTCASKAALADGRCIHTRIITCGCESNMFVRNALLTMYVKCGCLENARQMFYNTSHRNAVSWNVMIGAYAQHSQGKQALYLFEEMLLEGVIPSSITFLSILDACASLFLLAEGKRMHTFILRCGSETDVMVGNALINMYGKCGSLRDSQIVFDRMPERDVISWNAIITTYAQHGHGRKALHLFREMQLEGVTPNKVSFISILSACANDAALAEGKLIHAQVMRSLCTGDVVGNALISMYGKCGNVESALSVFQELTQQDVVSWNAMIAAYAQCHQGKKATHLFQQMQANDILPDKVTFLNVLSACANQSFLQEAKHIHACVSASQFKSDIVIANALLNIYGKCGSPEDAREVFDQMFEQNVVSWNAMIATYAHHGKGKEALDLFQQMQLENVMPNDITFISILSACSHTGLLDVACYYFVSMIQDFGISPTVRHCNCMVDLHTRAGWLDEGDSLIMNMPFQPTLMSWMSLLGACRVHFDDERGKHAADQIFQIDPENDAIHSLVTNMHVMAKY